jgi:predicted TIM-barrel fold metal-dependent hydrolase
MDEITSDEVVADDTVVDEPVEAGTDTVEDSDEVDNGAAKKARREAQALRTRLREAEAELAQFREAQMSETERAVAEARREAEAGMRAEVTKSRLREVAAGRLANPADAVVFCDLGNVDIDDPATLDAELSRILEERPYLGVQQQAPAIDQGPRQSPKAAPTFQQYMKQQLGH